jgi:hypothetical protein
MVEVLTESVHEFYEALTYKENRSSRLIWALLMFGSVFVFVRPQYAVMIIISLILIQFGHIWGGKLFGVEFQELVIKLSPKLAREPDQKIRPYAHACVELAGMLLGVLVGSVVAGIGLLAEHNPTAVCGVVILSVTMHNMAPCTGLNGYEIIRSLQFSNCKLAKVYSWTINVLCLSMLVLVGPTWVLCLVAEMFLFFYNNRKGEHFYVPLSGRMSFDKKVRVSFSMLFMMIVSLAVTLVVWQQCHGQWLYPFVQRMWPWSITPQHVSAFMSHF